MTLHDRRGGGRVRQVAGLAVLVFVLVAWAPRARAQAAAHETEPVRRALLVGCDEYPFLREALGKRFDDELLLRGPANDARLVRDTLARVLGETPERTVMLTGWGSDVESRPTRANILRELERLAGASRERDQVIVYLAGHGSQQRVVRDKPEEEPDGLEEIFLPADARLADKDQGHVPNSIRDDELGERVRAIRDAGADVWLIVDSCHSGTMLRGASAGLRLRGIDPALLGVAATQRGGAERERERGWLDGDTRRIAACYGATSYGRAPEMDLPFRAEGAQPHGLFTFLLCQELERLGPRATYRELSERVMAAYQAFPCAITVPTAEGDLERELLGGSARSAPFVCTLTSGVPSLNRGRLAGLEPGDVVEVFELARGVEHSVARLEITEADLIRARARVLEGELAEGTGPWRARCTAAALDDQSLALALVHADGSPAARSELPERLRSELAEQNDGFPLLDEPAAADWWIVVAGADGPWLRPGPREGGFDVCDVRADDVLARLGAVRRARNIRRFAGSDFAAPWQGDLVVSLERGGRQGWSALARGGVLHPGDRIRVRITKTSAEIYDVNVFYVDANLGLTALASESGSPRMDAATAERSLLEQTIVDDALGIESLLVFATPRGAASPVVDLAPLAQRGVNRGAAADPFERMLQQVLQGDGTRGAPQPVAAARGTQSLLWPLRVEWGPLAPPAWPAATVELSAAREGADALARDLDDAEPDASASGPRDPWEIGARGALAKSRRESAGHDLLLLGGIEGEVEAVLVDFDGGVAPDVDLARLVRSRSFDAEAAFLFGERRLAFYDRADDGSFDLVLEDGDGDGVAEARWTLAEGRWRREAPVALPWLSQSHVPLGARKSTQVSACLQALQVGP